MRQGLRRATAGLLLIAVTAAAACTSSGPDLTGSSSSRPGSTSTGTAPRPVSATWTETKVDVDGVKISVRCKGEASGAPPVLFVSGLGLDAATGWLDSGVPDAIATSTRACVYDRPGLGSSDPSVAERTLARHTDELSAVVAGAGITTPVVLVAQGFGSFIARVWATPAVHREDAAALVLIDLPLWALDPNAPANATAGQVAEYEAITSINDNLGGYGSAAMPPPPVPTIVFGVDQLLPSRPGATTATAPVGTAPVGTTPDGTTPDGTTPADGDDTTTPGTALEPSLEVRHARQREYALKSPFGEYQKIEGVGSEVQFWKPEVVIAAIRALPPA